MLKFFYPQINWDLIKHVGFDLDGTLYDEADFISQVYIEIAEIISKVSGKPLDLIYSNIFKKWLIKGSSYNRIFEEELSNIGIEKNSINELILICLKTFRSFQLNIHLSPRLKFLLDEFYKKYSIFLITDGNEILQSKKIESLGLKNWFRESNIMITGSYRASLIKPSVDIINFIECLNEDAVYENTVYFGDRKCDADFAKNANFQFVRVQHMFNLNRTPIL